MSYQLLDLFLLGKDNFINLKLKVFFILPEKPRDFSEI